ncbi:TetR/AcrR family transcriptional regulator [Sphingomonas profundi]|uniref:TetR/AcrR family transcriptional regulator n=1 Tax=Alterirhizorhabdus profundi TaxID=2681549 RepID=UPI0018D1DD95|nr:TetR/AcrR family transcriptional regulator [Sphingomonas profundi]
MRRTQRQRREATRQALLSAAVACVCERGYAGTTVARVADRAQVTRGAVQHLFGSRDDLFLAVIESVGQLNFEMDEAQLRALAPSRRLDAIIGMYRRVFSSQTFKAALTIWLGAAAEPALHARLGTFIERIQQPVDEVWRIAFGDLDVTAETLQSVRRIVMSAVRGYAIQDLFGLPNNWPADAILLAYMVAGILGMAYSADA